MTFALRYDPSRSEIVYEMRWSLKDTYSTRSDWHTMGLSVATHEERRHGGKQWTEVFGRALRYPAFIPSRNGHIRLIDAHMAGKKSK
jgi:hypothetical protein